jgi:hypothetical protein
MVMSDLFKQNEILINLLAKLDKDKSYDELNLIATILLDSHVSLVQTFLLLRHDRWCISDVLIEKLEERIDKLV